MRTEAVLRAIGNRLQEGLRELGVPEPFHATYADEFQRVVTQAADGTVDVEESSARLMQMLAVAQDLARVYGNSR
jgi:hypothetical protein